MAEELDEELYEELDRDEKKRGIPCPSECKRVCPMLYTPFDLAAELLYTLSDAVIC